MPRSISSPQGTKPPRSETTPWATTRIMMLEPTLVSDYVMTTVATPHESTTLDGAAATTMRRTEAPHSNLRAHKSSVELYIRHHSRLGFVHQLPSPRTREKRSLSYGSVIITWHVYWGGGYK